MSRPLFAQQQRCAFGESYQRWHKRVSRWKREHPRIVDAAGFCGGIDIVDFWDGEPAELCVP